MNRNFAKWVLSQLATILMLVVAGSAFAAPGDQLIHNSNNLGTKYGNWGTVGGKYGEFTCTTCHNKTTDNVKRVLTSIQTPNLTNWSSNKTSNTVSVSFNNMTAFGTDAAAHTTSTAICQVCHSKTTVHRYNKPVGQADSNHQGANQSDCTACHSHANGFKPQGCTACHGGNAASGTPMATGQHTAHIFNAANLGLNYGCVDCHAKTVTSDEGIKTAPTAHQNGTFGDYSGIRAGRNYSAGNCSNVYCHTNGKGGATATPVNWATGPVLDCKGCHGGGSSQAGEPVYVSSGAGTANANSHPKHVGTGGANATCQNCHGTTMSGTVLNASGKHTDKVIDIAQGNSKTFTYVGGTKTCSNISCHSGNGIIAGVADIQWGASMPADCTGCHGNEVNAATKLSGAHNSHINNASDGGVFKCKDCHAPTITNADNRTIATIANHGNALVNYSGMRSGKNNTCSTIYCHSNGKGTFAAIPTWASGTNLDCNGCHVTASLQSSHTKHLTAGAGCAQCHSSTTTAVAGDSITGSTHIDGTVNLQQGGIFRGKAVTFAPSGTTCNNISCHSAYASPSNTATWGVTATCETCHPKAGLSGHHTVHMGALDLAQSNNPASRIFYDMTANRTQVQTDTVLTHGFGCANCHPLNTGKHLDGNIDIDMSSKGVAGTSSIRFLNSTTAGKLPAYSGTCANIYCHSNASRVVSELVYKPTPTWVGGSFTGDRCAACHDNQPATGAHGAHAVGNHTDNIYNGKSGKVTTSNRANTAHGNPNNSTTIGCYICHQATVISKANDKNTKCVVCHYTGNSVGAQLKGSAAINNLKNHVNGAREIQFPAIKVVSKAQVRPRNSANTGANGFDFYSGIWKRTSYKNMSTLSYDTAKVALDTATMWHPSTPMASNCTNIACHNGRPVAWNLANWNDPNKCMDCHNAL